MKIQDPPAENLQAIINLYIQKKFQEALLESTQMLEKFPESIVLYNIIGATNAALMQFDEAISSYKQALSINPNYADAYYNMGASFKDKGDLDSAIDCYQKALKINPNYAEAYNNMGASFKDKGDLDSAIDCYQKALKINPNYAEAYNNMGASFKDKGDLDSAIDCYQKALKINPNYAEAFINECELYEQANKLDNLRAAISNAKDTLNKIPEDILLYEALYYLRLNNHKHAQNIVSLINVEQLSKIKRPLFFQLEAKLHQQNQKYELAFNSFAKMNDLIMKFSSFNNGQAQIFFQDIKDKRQQLCSVLDTPFSQIMDNTSTASPVFLIGFPRSGTTLLDTILRTHSKIEVIEEKEMLSEVQANLGKKLSIVDIENLTFEEIKYAREIYEKELVHFNQKDKSSYVIDKLPLNILEVPLIQKLFPKSKIILAVRHPLDAILSCWMQLFDLNPAMANMLDLDRTADFYNEAMTILEICDKRYSLDMYTIRYEDLVEDMELEISKLLTFLELDWEDNMQSYKETALERGLVGTPSYSQVVQPIYKTASYRWEKYRTHLEKYFSKVEKWSTKFGYEL
jgi:Flp pilus assembly protein TadD